MKRLSMFSALAVILTVIFAASSSAQITPSQDAYTSTANPTTNYGAATTLGVVNTATSIQNAYIQFDLSSLPAGYTSSNITKATLKLYVNTVPTAGSFNIDFVNGAWAEKKINANLVPALGSTIVASVPLTSANVKDYLLIDITSAVGAWLDGTQANNGIALVANSPFSATFDSKENTAQSHPPELDIVFAGGGGGGTITGINTASGSGLIGGGTSGTLNLSLTNTCAANQVLQWSGSAWGCADLKGNGTITGVTAGTDLTGGGTSGNVTLNLDTTKVPQLSSNNTFSGTQTMNNGASVTATGTALMVRSTNNAGNGIQASTNWVSGFGVAGLNTGTAGSGSGVYGSTTTPTGAGVQGVAASGPGVLGQTTGTSAPGVWGVNSVSGFGIVGQATGSSGQGVWGESFGTSFSNGAGADGVHGVTHSLQGSGVAGINSAKDGVGIYGSDTNGYGFVTDSHVAQVRGMGGWVKAMAYVDPSKGGIQRCFNSQIAGSQATAVPCGITYTYFQAGNYEIDFGFDVDDRFVQATIGSYRGGVGLINLCLADYQCFKPNGPTQVNVAIFNGSNGIDQPFFISVF